MWTTPESSIPSSPSLSYGLRRRAVLQNLILNYLSHFGHTPDRKERESYQAYLLDTVRGIWNEFARKFDEVWANNNRGELVALTYWDFPEVEQPSPNTATAFSADSFKKQPATAAPSSYGA